MFLNSYNTVGLFRPTGETKRTELISSVSLLSPIKLKNVGKLIALFTTCIHVRFFLGLFFHLEDGRDMILRNVGRISGNYTTLYSRTQLFATTPFSELLPHKQMLRSRLLYG
jgi:hypothetical protein